MVHLNPARQFTLVDFRRLLERAGKRMPSNEWTASLAGTDTPSEGLAELEQKEADRLRGIIDSMTPEERRDPVNLLTESRSRRIAAGAGVGPQEVVHLVQQFQGMAEIMNQLARRRPPSG